MFDYPLLSHLPRTKPSQVLPDGLSFVNATQTTN